MGKGMRRMVISLRGGIVKSVVNWYGRKKTDTLVI